MRSLILIILLYSSFLKAQTTTIPDPNFEQALISLGYDIGPINGSVPTANISSITYLSILNKNINNLTGIEDFSSLSWLECGGNQITNLKATLSNNLGQVIFRKEYESVNYINFNIEAPKGIYFLQLESENKTVTKKIIKK